MTGDLNPSAYDTFAPFYEDFTAASDYDTGTEQVLPGGHLKRPGDATTSRGMAPKVELRRITTISAELPLDRAQEAAEEVLALDGLLRELDGLGLSP
jgi:hypothetical protein